MSDSPFPLDAEQIVRLTAAVVWELSHPGGCEGDTRDAMLLRLADSVGLPLATEDAAIHARKDGPPQRGPRGTLETRWLCVRDYPAVMTEKPIASSSPDNPAGRHEG